MNDRLTELASAASDRYRINSLALAGAYAQALRSGNVFAKRTRQGLDAELVSIGNFFLQNEESHSENAFDGVMLDSASLASADLGVEHTPDGTWERMTDAFRSTETALARDLAGQVQRDINSVRDQFHRMLMQANLNSMTSGSRTSHLKNLILRDPGVSFGYKDRANRKWDGQVYVRTLWRHALLTASNDVYLGVVADAGHKQARVDGPEDNSHHGLVFNIADEGEDPTYTSIRGEVFHPNSQMRPRIVSQE